MTTTRREQQFVERSRRWARIADALEAHPARDALFSAMQEIDRLYQAEAGDQVEAAYSAALIAAAEEREQLLTMIAERDDHLRQLLGALATSEETGKPKH